MKNFGELGFDRDQADGAGQHKYDDGSAQVSSGRKRKKALELTPKRAQKRRNNKSSHSIVALLETEVKSMKKANESLQKTMKSQDEETRKLKSYIEELKLRYTGQKRVYDHQIDHMEEVKNLMRETMALLGGGSPSLSNVISTPRNDALERKMEKIERLMADLISVIKETNSSANVEHLINEVLDIGKQPASGCPSSSYESHQPAK